MIGKNTKYRKDDASFALDPVRRLSVEFTKYWSYVYFEVEDFGAKTKENVQLISELEPTF